MKKIFVSFLQGEIDLQDLINQLGYLIDTHGVIDEELEYMSSKAIAGSLCGENEHLCLDYIKKGFDWERRAFFQKIMYAGPRSIPKILKVISIAETNELENPEVQYHATYS